MPDFLFRTAGGQQIFPIAHMYLIIDATSSLSLDRDLVPKKLVHLYLEMYLTHRQFLIKSLASPPSLMKCYMPQRLPERSNETWHPLRRLIRQQTVRWLY